MIEKFAGHSASSTQIREYTERAYNFAYRLSGNEQIANELVNGAFSRAMNYFEKCYRSNSLAPWFQQILKYMYFDGMRIYECNHYTESNSLSNTGNPTIELLQAGLNSLPITYKTAILLHDIEKYSYGVIAVIMECPNEIVRSLIYDGRILLRAAYGKLLSNEAGVKVLERV